MSGFFKHWLSDFRSPKPYVIWFILSVIIGFAGPFGTYNTIFLPKRLLLWALLISAAILIGVSNRAFVFGALNMRGFWDGTILVAGLNAVSLPPVIAVIRDFVHVRMELPSYNELASFAFLVTLGVGAYRRIATTGASPAIDPHPDPSACADPNGAVLPVQKPETLARIQLRLPEAIRGDLIAISVRDHYVDVVTEKGSVGLLMRLSDAVEETEPTDGARVHRSHWVAWDAVEGVEKSAERLQLRMRNGGLVPVSKTYRALVEARGIGMARAELPPQRMATAALVIKSERAGSSHHSPPV